MRFVYFNFICGCNVKKVLLKKTLAGLLMLLACVLAGCGTPAAKDFGGSWKSVNRFQSMPTEIPLAQRYTFFASPMDGTLKAMLTRWSNDAGMTLSYQLRSDFTLYTPVSKIHTSDIREAADELSSIYAGEGVAVTINGQQILVQPAGTTRPDVTANKEAAGTLRSTAPANPKPMSDSGSR